MTIRGRCVLLLLGSVTDMAQKGFIWKSDTLTKNVKVFPQKLDRAIYAAVEYGATRGEAAMKRGARWRDQTGNARNGLFTATEHDRATHRIIFAHGVAYGIWLEVRWNGKYAIIMPTMVAQGEQLMAMLGKLLAGLGK